ncbi:hypothetical protein IL54_3960 [Sphingobium sp. ba1]|nr:hypothetical protein IL54_3960 [Sphingobium sp. ba1]
MIMASFIFMQRWAKIASTSVFHQI